MDDRVREESARSDEERRHPPIDEVSRVPCQRNAKEREHRNYSGLRSDEKMTERSLGKLALDHEQQARCARFHGLMPEEHQAELMFCVDQAPETHAQARHFSKGQLKDFVAHTPLNTLLEKLTVSVSGAAGVVPRL